MTCDLCTAEDSHKKPLDLLVKRINKIQDRLQAVLTDVDRRVVRLETMVEIAGGSGPKLIR